MEAQRMNNPVEDYIDELELCGRTFGTIKQTNQVLKNFQKICNGKGILRVDEDDIKAFIRDMRNQKFADRTIKEYVSTLDRFYDFVVDSKR